LIIILIFKDTYKKPAVINKAVLAKTALIRCCSFLKTASYFYTGSFMLRVKHLWICDGVNSPKLGRFAQIPVSLTILPKT